MTTVYSPLDTIDAQDSDEEVEEHIYPPEPSKKTCNTGFVIILFIVLIWAVGCLMYASGGSDDIPDFPLSETPDRPTSPNLDTSHRNSESKSSSIDLSYTHRLSPKPTIGEDAEPPTPTFAPTPKPVRASIITSITEKPTLIEAEPPTPTFAPTPKPVPVNEAEPPTPTYAPTPKPVPSKEAEPPTPTYAPTPKPVPSNEAEPPTPTYAPTPKPVAAQKAEPPSMHPTPKPTEGSADIMTTKWPNQPQSYGKYFFTKYQKCGPEITNLKKGQTLEEIALLCDHIEDCVGYNQNDNGRRQPRPNANKNSKEIEIVDVPVKDPVHIDMTKPERSADFIAEHGPRYEGNPDQTTQQFMNPSSDADRIDDLGSPRKSIDFDIDDAIKTFQDQIDHMCNLWPGNDENCKILAVPFQPPLEVPGEMTPLQRKLARVILEEKPEDRHFVASFTGSSNSAGHGAKGKHTYPLGVNFACRETFKSIGVDFTSRNQALGSMGAYPHSTMCHSSLFGFDADFVTYEFGMFREGDCPKEMWARLGFQLPRQPVVAVMNPGGPSHCATHYGNYYGKFKGEGRIDEFMSHMGKNSGKFPVPETPEWYLSDEYMTQSGRSEADLEWLEKNLPVTEDHKRSMGKIIEKNTCTPGTNNCNQGIQDKYNPDLGFYDFRFVLGSYIDHLPFYLMRSQICRMAHHPSDLGHFMAAEQVGYQFLRETVNVLKLIKEHNTEEGLSELYVKATKKYPLPPESKLPGCHIAGEERLPICWTSFRPQNGPSLYDIVEDYQGWKMQERFSPYSGEREEYGYRDEHRVIEGLQEDGWLTLKPVTVTPEITKNHDDGTAWLSVCNGMLRYCDDKKGKPCTSWHVKDDVQFKINDEIVVFDNTWERFEAGARKDTVQQLGKWLPFHTSTKENYHGITDHVNMRSGYCLALKNVPPGDYKIEMRVVNPNVRTWLTHVMIL